MKLFVYKGGDEKRRKLIIDLEPPLFIDNEELFIEFEKL